MATPETQQPVQQVGAKKVFQAKQNFSEWVFSEWVNDEKSPVLPPDIIATGTQFSSADEARQKYKELWVNNMQKHNQFIPAWL